MTVQLLVHFLDGSSHGCTPETEWTPFTHSGNLLEWCEARGFVVSRVVAVRLASGGATILGATVSSTQPLTEADARSVVEAHGGLSMLRLSKYPSLAPPPASERKKDPPWFQSLAKHGFIRENEMTSFLSQQYRVPTIDLEAYAVGADVLELVPREICDEHCVLPVSRAGTSLIVAMTDPSTPHVLAALHRVTGHTIEPVIASEKSIRGAIKRYYDA